MTFKKLTTFLCALIFISGAASAQNGRWEKNLSGNDWRLWLDKAAIWSNDDIYLPPVNVAKLPVNPPTIGWDKLHSISSAIKTSVPGTVEQHYWGAIGGIIPDVGGDYTGVSWWSRKFTVDNSQKGKRITLAFQSTNLRAEVFVNGKLVGYDVVGNTPFEVDATSAIAFGKENTLDIRITDPVGNFAWDDNSLMRWGKNLVPAIHGFGGITGNVILRATDKVNISDIYVQNEPEPKKVNVIVTLDNHTGNTQNGNLTVVLHEKGKPAAVVFTKTTPVSVSTDPKTVTIAANAPNAKLWEISEGKTKHEANLYEATVTFVSNDKKIIDNSTQRFGFRWFDVGEKDGDKRFYLNGKRVFIMSAMTRGFWPTNGIFPTPAMAKRDMNTMFDLGLNTMLMHRAIGQPLVMNYADSAGLFTYEEPGGYRILPNKREGMTESDEQSYKWRSIKLERMVNRDRSFPSMIIYNLKNEETAEPIEADKKDMQMVHQIDPTRIITYNSGSDIQGDVYSTKPNNPFELNMLPNNQNLIYGGWFDQHHWYSYSGYTDEMWRNPKFYLRGVINGSRVPLAKDSLYSLDKSKVLFFGEEGAFGAMVRLQKIKEEVEHTGATGFREQEHLDWFKAYNTFLDETGFRKSYPDVDSLTRSLGRNLHYFHARNIENIRVGNIGDAYNMNGWASASTRTDVVDMYRNPTADASIIKHYTQPLYIAVKLRNKVIPVGMAPIADLYIINEKDLKGKHNLHVVLLDSKGAKLLTKDYAVNVAGGETFGQLLVEGLQLPSIKSAGYYKLYATLDAAGVKKTDGYDDIFAVDVSNNAVNNSTMVLESDNAVKDFLKKVKGVDVASYSADAKANVIIIGKNAAASLKPEILTDLMNRVQAGAKLVVLDNADVFAKQIAEVFKAKPAIYAGTPIANWGGSGRLFVGRSEYLNGLPQAQGMSWEYQIFYKGPKMGEQARVAGIKLNNWGITQGGELIAAVGNQGSKEILTSLVRIPVGKGNVILSTLNILPNLPTNEPIAAVAKKLFLNLIK